MKWEYVPPVLLATLFLDSFVVTFPILEFVIFTQEPNKNKKTTSAVYLFISFNFFSIIGQVILRSMLPKTEIV